MNSLVSIILPVYNSEKYITECLESILKQTYKYWELIIVDDGSTDQSENLILEYLSNFNNPTKYIKLSHQGLPYCLNLGISYAKGEYIARIDADDVMINHRIEKQIQFLEENKDIGVCGSNAIEIDEYGREFSIVIMPEYDKIIKKQMSFINSIIHPSVLIRKQLFTHFSYNNLYPNPEDYELWTHFSKITNFHNYQEPLIKKRYHVEQITSKIDKVFTYRFVKLSIRHAISKKDYFSILRLYKSFFKLLLPKQITVILKKKHYRRKLKKWNQNTL